VLVLLFFVRDKRVEPVEADMPSAGASVNAAVGFSTRFKCFLVVMAVFTLGNSSDFFVVLRAQDLGSPVLHITLMLVVLNLAYTAFSVPSGVLSVRLGRRRIIALGWLVYALVYLGFAVAASTWQIWGLFIGYGIYYGITEGVARAFVADLVPEERRGTAYGLYQGVVGIMLLPASLLAGWLWDTVSTAAPFYLGAGLAFIATLGLLVIIRE
jgi:MFS family permease